MLDEKTIGNDPSSLFNGNHYPSIYIYICMYVGMYVCRGPKTVGGNTWAKRAHAQSQYCAVKSDL